MSLSIKILTAIVIAMAAGLIMRGFHDQKLMIGGILLAVVAFVCYLLTPASYDVSSGCLTVLLHAGRRSFGEIVECASLAERPPFSIRLFGNSGLFGVTGIFWNKHYGIFRVYASSARQQDLVLVQTKKYRVLITPQDPQAFLKMNYVVPQETP